MRTAEIMQLPPHGRARRRTLWSWLRDVALAFDRRSAGQRREYGAPEAPLGLDFGEPDIAASQPHAVERGGTAVLPFPIRGEAVLARLAHVLRGRIGETGPDGDPLLLTISRGSQCRLTIDGAAYVEFCHDRSGFHVEVEATPDTTVSLRTTDFDIVVGFVMHYVGEKLGGPAMLEAAS